MIAAVVLARGGSKGIPDKNIQPVGGVPLIVRTADALARSRFSPVYVWTDSDTIREVARVVPGVNVDVPRPAALAGDSTTSEESMRSLIELEDPDGKWDGVALVQCTTPFLRTEHMDEAVHRFLHGGFDSVVTAVDVTARFYGYPHHDGDYDFIPMRPYRALRQEPGGWKLWMENGGIYLAKRSLWMDGRRIGRRCGVVEMAYWESMEIDEPEDLLAASLLAPMFEARDVSEEMAEEPSRGLRFIYHEEV